MPRTGFSIDCTIPPTAYVLAAPLVAVDADDVFVGSVTDRTPRPHATIARLPTIAIANMRFMVHRFRSARRGPFATLELSSSACHTHEQNVDHKKG